MAVDDVGGKYQRDLQPGTGHDGALHLQRHCGAVTVEYAGQFSSNCVGNLLRKVAVGDLLFRIVRIIQHPLHVRLAIRLSWPAFSSSVIRSISDSISAECLSGLIRRSIAPSGLALHAATAAPPISKDRRDTRPSIMFPFPLRQ